MLFIQNIMGYLKLGALVMAFRIVMTPKTVTFEEAAKNKRTGLGRLRHKVK